MRATRLGTVALALVLPAIMASTAEAKRVAAPHFVRNIQTGETGWFSSPSLVDLAGDKRLEIVAPFYSTFVYSAGGRLLGKGTATSGRVSAPGVVADLDGDGTKEIVPGGNGGDVAAYDLTAGGLRTTWRASTCSGGQCPETRGLAAGDLDRDGRIEVVATTTNTSGTGVQVFAFDADGDRAPGWPRYNRTTDAAEREGRGPAPPPAHRRLAGRADDGVAAVDRLAALDRRPRPRRPQRGHRPPERREEDPVRDAGLRVHGARRRVRERQPLRSPSQGDSRGSR